MAHGIKQGISPFGPKICSNEFEKEGAACTATKWNFPTLSESVMPKVDFDCDPVIVFAILTMFR